MKKIIALLLACVMVLGLFAACGDGKPADTTNGTPDTTSGSNTPDTTTGGTDEVVELTWYMVGNGTPVNYDSWKQKVDAYLEEKINVHLNIECVGWDAWGERRSVVVSTNGDYDLMFTDMGSYATDVAMGAFADITDLMAEVPGLTELIPQNYLDACKIGGKLYAIPAYKDSSMTNFFVWTKEHVDAYYPEYADGHKLADLTEGLRALKEGTGTAPILLNQDGISCITGNKYDAATLGNCGIGIAYNNGTEFVPVFEQADVIADLTLLHQWFNEGLINADAATLPKAEGMCSMGVAQGWPGAAKGWGAGRGAEVVVSQYEDTVVSSDTVMGSLTCINANSEHKLEALKLLELVNTDTKLRDMLWFGEEGVNFDYVEENGVQKVEKHNNDWALAAYTQGTFFVATPEKGTDGFGEVRTQNENAISSPAFGFIPDRTEIGDKLDELSSIFSEYKAQIYTGTADPTEVLPEMMEAMRDAGFDEVLTEVNRQFAEWKAVNG